MNDSNPIAPLAKAHRKDGVMQCPFHGESITMILRHGDARQAANRHHQLQKSRAMGGKGMEEARRARRAMTEKLISAGR